MLFKQHTLIILQIQDFKIMNIYAKRMQLHTEIAQEEDYINKFTDEYLLEKYEEIYEYAKTYLAGYLSGALRISWRNAFGNKKHD